RYRLRASRLGYQTTDTELIEVQDHLETVVTIVLGTEAVPLEPLRVEATRLPLHHQFADIEERMRLGGVHFITREEIDAQPNAKVSDLLRNIPGARVSTTRFGDLVVQLRARGSMRELPSDETRVGAYRSANPCPAKLYVDGILWVKPHNVHLFEGDTSPTGVAASEMFKNEDFMRLHGGDVEVIEVYNGPASTPAIYSGSDAECGVVAVWLRRTHEQAVVNPRRRRPPAIGVLRAPDMQVAAVAYGLAGGNAPSAGYGVEAAAHWPAWGRIEVSLFLRRTSHALSAETTHTLTSTLSTTQY